MKKIRVGEAGPNIAQAQPLSSFLKTKTLILTIFRIKLGPLFWGSEWHAYFIVDLTIRSVSLVQPIPKRWLLIIWS